jgi:hypothetical protein
MGGDVEGSPMSEMIKQHHSARLANAQMYANASKTAVGNYLHAQQGIDPRTNQRFDDPDYKGINPITGQPFANAQEAKDALQQYYNNQHEEAWGNYTKIAGVNPEAKGALGKAQAILQHIMGQGAVQGVPQQQPQRGGQMAAPPAPSTPNYPTTVGEAGVTQTAAPQARGMAPPPQAPSGPSFLAQAPFLRAQEEFTRGLGQRKAEMVSDVDTRTALVNKVIPEADREKPYVQDYKLTGNISRGMAAQFKMQRGPLVMDEYGIPHATFVNPDTSVGGIVDSINMQPITKGTPISQSDLSAHQIFYEGPGGEKLFGYTFGTGENKKLYDQGFQELPAGTKGWSAADVVKTTKGSAERIDSVTGERQILHTTRTIGPQNKVAPAVTAPAVQGPPSPNSTPLPPAGTKITGPGGYKAGTQQAPATNKPSSSPTGKLSGPTGVIADQDARREEAYQKRTNLKNLTSSTRTMVEFAPKVNNFIDRIEPQIDGLQNELGPVAGRWNEFWTGKVGTSNPEYMKLRTNVDLLTTALMKMHVGARGSDMIMQHFKDLIAQGKQSPDNMKAALEEIKSYAGDIIQEGKDAGVDPTTPIVRGRNAMPAPPTAPTTTKASSAGGSLGYTDGGKNYNIPKEMVADFLKDHPNAKPR